MLDLLITRQEDESLSFSVYRKPTHTDQYLSFESHQPLEHKLGVIRTLTHRANIICSTNDAKHHEIQHIKKVLSISGYPRWAWNSPSNKKRTPHPARAKPQKPKGHVSIPYVSGVSEAIARKIRKTGVAVHTKPHNSLRSQLVAPKDKTNALDKSNVVYHIKCQDCSSHYIGETERTLGKRVKEHHRESSPVGLHLKEKEHSFSTSQIKVLETENNWFRRGVKEAISIHTLDPDLNRDKGRYFLPPVYGSLIRQSRDASRRQRHVTDPAPIATESSQ